MNWFKIGMYAVIYAAIYGAGYMQSNVNHAQQDAEQAHATAEEIARLSREHTDEMRALALVSAGKEKVFTKDITEIRMHEAALLEQINVAQLTKPVAEVRVEACVETDGESDVQVVIANPFSDSFRVFWNQASRNLRSTGSEGTDPE